MKRHGILNSSISKVLADLGHTDRIAIGDAGLPIPAGTVKIDLALKEGVPGFIEVVQVVQEEMCVEKVTTAEEMKSNPAVQQEMRDMFTAVEMDELSHEAFKQELTDVKAVIRTGEMTPYANCILHAGVIF
ncbi:MULTISPECIES: D-ribose pyranase [Halobacillus]|uniref:D-ribose pyranase n=1 Tax=Halobacillus TaxID=45667 RepID=UPI00136CBF72|nr:MULTISPECIES: D-ribose pyranase [Halobacillus]MYL31168.1 D-ribose pyranase [Halobacillus halophilus]MYL39634.1 D-ribose pyranase [Halobacillus litoralis]